MRLSRVKLLIGTLFVVIVLFSAVNAQLEGLKIETIEEEDEATTAPLAESSPVKSVELPTFTV